MRKIGLAIAFVVTLAMPALAETDDQDTGDYSDCGGIDPDQPCYSTSGGNYTCIGIGGCRQCVRDPFTLNQYDCKFVDDATSGVCKCGPTANGGCWKEGTCSYFPN